MSLTGTVALKTHMLHTKVSADVEDPGPIVISDLSKVLTFTKALPKESMVVLSQPKPKVVKKRVKDTFSGKWVDKEERKGFPLRTVSYTHLRAHET